VRWVSEGTFALTRGKNVHVDGGTTTSGNRPVAARIRKNLARVAITSTLRPITVRIKFHTTGY
jgi:hypothetical protein